MSTLLSGASTLLDDLPVEAPPTEGIKYAGSKRKLLPHILQLARKVNPATVLDGFSGTTRVSQAFARMGCRVIANDISAWSHVFGTCYLLNPYPGEHYQALIAHLNSLPGKDGWFTAHYGGEAEGQKSGLKRPWQKHNTRKLDAIREEIDRLELSYAEKAVLLTSLILALDEVDSTLGHYASYLNEWSPRSFRKLTLSVPQLIPRTTDHEVYQADIFDILPRLTADLAYFDPPYGSNNEKMPPSRVRYAAYYHLWTTICLGDRPRLFGKAKRRIDTSDKVAASEFEEFRRNEEGKFIAVAAIQRLLQQTPARFVILSYSSGGRATVYELQEAIQSAGRLIEVTAVDYKRHVMGGMRWTHEWIRSAEEPNKEFLFLIERF
ncbi:MAG TPA: DNA adenine methylase [Chthonomonadaceae bacterium]|nr:DNA adenine methylase [Chthonomonadaceae bacterium]